LPETLAFDLYGTLVDPLRIAQQLERALGSAAQRTAELWRLKQLEYTFRLTAMQRYEDFEQVTAKALDFALAVVGHELSADDRRQTMAAYDDLDLFPDVAEGLRQAHDAGYPMIVLSNGNPRMVHAAVRSAGLESWFEELISVDEVQTYKLSPLVYQHAAGRLGRAIGEVRLISSNPFDVIGATAVGMQVAWLDRAGAVFDTLGPPPAMVVKNLTELVGRLQETSPR
jgi:2-haloacid dehalogenase